MEIISKCDLEKVRFDQENLVTLLVSCKAPVVELETERQPLNLCAVLDVSGSMHGAKIKAMKKSVQILIDHLTEKDQLGLVIFSTQVEKLASAKPCTSERKAELKERVSKLHAMSTTNISGATLLGFELLRAIEGKISRILLFTDGLPNVGVTSHSGLVELVKERPKSLSLSTFGFGTDHNPELLMSMARAGEGNFYYIESVDNIASAFAQELGGLLTCYAQNISLKVTAKSGVQVDEVLNDAFEYEIKDDVTEVRIPDMFGEEKRNIVMKLKLEKRTSALPREVCTADILVTFTNLVTKKTEEVKSKIKLTFVKEGEESTERYTEVVEAETFLEAAKKQAEAVKMANVGDFTGARAIMAQCCADLNAVGSEDALAQGASIQSWSNDLTSDHYSASVGYTGIQRSYSSSTGRAGGQSSGVFSGTTAQKKMVRSFEQGVGEKSEVKRGKKTAVPGVVGAKKVEKGGMKDPSEAKGEAKGEEKSPEASVKPKKPEKKKVNKPMSDSF